ncbi:MAG: hypothetical protein QOH63_2956 [Acidobacteriota bacterium]|jgi:hypothetical protein|nr:hypothetical protein [Acidobacteriota bacterium]
MEVTKGPARKLVPARDWIDKNEIRALTDAGVIITDERRRRPLYFDGRFLTARDLTGDQNYFLTRQADLGQAGGTGVVHGLMVQMVEGSAIRIEAGHGVTTSGELVVISNSIPRLDLTNIPEMQRLNAAFGLSQIPNEPARTRSGLFVLALRPVEYTANPIASYPTSINGPRTVEDGDVIEAVAITLIPYPDEGSRSEVNMRRARIAQKIFVEGGTQGVPAGVLPLAMIALDRGVVRWVDSFMVRREVGAEHGNIVGLGFAPRALREAHLLQYEYHLREVVRERAVRGLRFAATEHFLSLPAAGQMPAAAIDPNNFTQIFFPASVQVDLSIIPQDELPALIEESLLLPPIDLTLDDEQLASTAVLALVPVSRQDFRSFQGKLSNLQRRLAPAAPDMIAKRPPVEALRLLNLPFAAETVAGNLGDDTWRTALSKTPLLWFVRRRNLSYKAELSGISASIFTANEKLNETNLIKTLQTNGLAQPFKKLQSASTAQGNAELVSFLSSPAFEQSPVLMRSALNDLEKESEGGLDRTAVHKVAANFADPQLGQGLARLENASPGILDKPAVVNKLIESGKLHELDRNARQSSEQELTDLAREFVGGSAGAKRTQTKTGTKGETTPPEETKRAARGTIRVDAKDSSSPLRSSPTGKAVSSASTDAAPEAVKKASKKKTVAKKSAKRRSSKRAKDNK